MTNKKTKYEDKSLHWLEDRVKQLKEYQMYYPHIPVLNRVIDEITQEINKRIWGV